MRFSGTCALAAVTAGLLAWTPTASAQTADVTGVVRDKGGNVLDDFVGTFTLSHLDVQDDQLVAVGTLTGEVTRKNGKPKQLRNVRVALPVDLESSGIGLGEGAAGGLASISGSPPGVGCACGAVVRDELAVAAVGECDVLNLVLGPLDLNLLGLEISLNQVVLDVVADATGGLLGQLLQLLCGLNLGGLLDLLGDLAFLADLLNFLFGL